LQSEVSLLFIRLVWTRRVLLLFADSVVLSFPPVCGPLAMVDEVEDTLAALQLGILKGTEGCSEVMGKVERFGW